MTGYGSSSVEKDGVFVTVEIWSVNSRFLNFSAKLPGGLEFLEEGIRRETKRTCKRGRVSVVISVGARKAGTNGEFHLDKERFEAYMSLLKTIKRDYGATVSIADLVDIKELITDDIVEETNEKLILDVLQEAMERLGAMRSTEGQIIADDFRTRIANLGSLLKETRSLWENSLPLIRDGYERRIRELLEGKEIQVDEARLVQETAIIVEKMDITEECVRCASHLEQFKTLLEEQEPVGKRMNFLLQEIQREINTIGSKSNEIQITRNIVDMKDEVEKIREQVQNVL